jgi:hypothetical protein
MAAVRLPAEKGRPAGIALDTTRAAGIAAWGGFDPAELSAALHPAAPAPLVVRGSRLTFDLTAAKLVVGKSLLAAVVLAPVAGPADESVDLGELFAGRHSYVLDVPACADGCLLKAIQFNGREGSLDVTGTVTLHAVTASVSPSAAGVPPEVLGSAGRWQITDGAKLSAGPSGLQVEVTSLNGLPYGAFLRPAGLPGPLPVATAGDVATSAVLGLDGRPLPIAAALRLPAVPGVGAPAVLADLDYADRLATDANPSSTAQVWLAPGAPADILDRLRSAGLVVTTDTRAAQVRARLDKQGPALALWFYLLVAALAAALAAGALVLAAAVDRGRRIEDLSALRAQGLPRTAVSRATLWTYPVMVGAAVIAGTAIALLGWWLTGWALPLAGLHPPALPFPSLPRAWSLLVTAVLTFAILAGVAVVAGRRTLQEIR